MTGIGIDRDFVPDARTDRFEQFDIGMSHKIGVAELMYDIAITSGRLRQREERWQKTMNSKLESIECPECKSTRVNENGHKAGKQNHICIDCGRQFIDSYMTRVEGENTRLRHYLARASPQNTLLF